MVAMSRTTAALVDNIIAPMFQSEWRSSLSSDDYIFNAWRQMFTNFIANVKRLINLLIDLSSYLFTSVRYQVNSFQAK